MQREKRIKSYDLSLRLCLILGCFSAAVDAQPPVTVVGLIEQAVPLPVEKIERLRLSTQRTQTKSLSLLKLRLSPLAKKGLRHRVMEAQTHSDRDANEVQQGFPSSIYLDIPGPILDQGSYGTCATFAMTTALNGALGKGDHVSQLCQLELGHYLQNYGYFSDGWNGQSIANMAVFLDMFGFISKEVQSQGKCAGRLEYPLLGKDIPSESLSVMDYHQYSQSLEQAGVGIFTLLTEEQAFSGLMNGEDVFLAVKIALAQHAYVAIGVMLLDIEQGTAGATAHYHHDNDTWVMTNRLEQSLLKGERPSMAGHALVVVGFDDEAVVTDSEGVVHKGLVILRNSWGDQLGDQGIFYMTYAYFKDLLLEAYVVGRLDDTEES